MGWLSGWSYRKSHVVNAASGAGTNYQVRIIAHYGSGTDSGADVYLNSHCRTDFGDIRFTDDDGETLLDYWMEEKVDGDYAIFWVEVKEDLSTNSATVYIYYGKSDASTTSNGDSTFIFGDDFPGTSLDTNKWDEAGTGTITVSGGVINIKTTASWGHKRILTKSAIDLAGRRIIERYQPKVESAQTNQVYYDQWTLFREAASDRLKLYSYQSGVWDVRWTSTNTYPLNTWYKRHILLKQGNIKVVSYNDNYTIRDESTWVNWDYSTKKLGFGQASLNEEGSWDYVWLAKYVDPEPGHGAWGSEETSGAAIVTVADTLGFSDITLCSKAFAVADGVGLSETPLRNWTPQVSDILNLSENALTSKILQLLDSFSASDNALADKNFGISDLVNLSELANVILAGVLRQVLDNLNLTDQALANKMLVVFDALWLSEHASTDRQIRLLEELSLTENLAVSKIVKLADEVSLVETIERGVAGAAKTRLFLVLGDMAIQLTG
jgi:hypothetical protein